MAVSETILKKSLSRQKDDTWRGALGGEKISHQKSHKLGCDAGKGKAERNLSEIINRVHVGGEVRGKAC